MKRSILALLALVVVLVGGVSAPASAGLSDILLVKSATIKAFNRQPSYSQNMMCRKWRNNPTGSFFIKLSGAADRIPGVSPYEAGRGVAKAFIAVCGYPTSY